MAGTAPSEAPKPTPTEAIRGKDWRKEVGSVRYNREETRKKFYLERAKFKLNVSSEFNKLLEDPSKHGLKKLEELERAADFRHESSPKDTLFNVLDKYFKETVGVTDNTTRQREVYLTMFWLANHTAEVSGKFFNVDYLRQGDVIEIKQGKISITRRTGKQRIVEQLIRRPSGPAYGPENATP